MDSRIEITAQPEASPYRAAKYVSAFMNQCTKSVQIGIARPVNFDKPVLVIDESGPLQHYLHIVVFVELEQQRAGS